MFKAEFRENDEFRQRSLSAPLGCASGLFGRQKENRRVVRTCAIQKAACACHGLVQTFMDLYGFVSYIYIEQNSSHKPHHTETRGNTLRCSVFVHLSAVSGNQRQQKPLMRRPRFLHEDTLITHDEVARTSTQRS